MTRFKLFCSVVFGVTLASCGGPRTLVVHSEVAMTSEDERVLYLKGDGIGLMMYETWMSGAYGDSTQVHLLTPTQYETLLKKKAKKN